MELVNQVCTLVQAKKLKELGVIQDSLFAYCVVMPDPIGEKYYHDILYKTQDELQTKAPIEVLASAFTVAELGEMLPINIISAKQKSSDTFACIALISGSNDVDYSKDIQHEESEAQARAAMLIHLIEKNLISVVEINQRLQNA